MTKLDFQEAKPVEAKVEAVKVEAPKPAPTL